MARFINDCKPNPGVPHQRGNIAVDRGQVVQIVDYINDMMKRNGFTLYTNNLYYSACDFGSLELAAAIQIFVNAGWTVTRYETGDNSPYYEFR